MKIFLDVGAHTGQTARAVLDPKYQFDKIICFEPVEICGRRIENSGDKRITVHYFGLWNQTCERLLFGPGGEGASIFNDKDHLDTHKSVPIRLVKASDWFRENIHIHDGIYIKINCEGCECDIIDDLIQSGHYAKLKAVLIMLDVEKIPSQRHRAQQIKERLASTGLSNFTFSNDLVGSSHRPRIQYWLHAAEADCCPPLVRLQQVGFDLKRFTIRCTNSLRSRLLRRVNAPRMDQA